MSFTERTLYRPLVWSVATALLGAGALLSIQMISAVVGPFRLSQLGASDPRADVALFRDLSAPVGFAVRSAFAHDLVGSGRSVHELTALADLDPARTGVIVLSEPRVLREAEAADLRNYVAGGGGAVLVGSVGVRDPDGTWRGYDTMRGLLGADVVPLEEDRAQAIVATRRGPIAAALAPRQRISVTSEPGLPGALLPDAELRWSGLRHQASEPAASLRRSFGKGRLAWVAVGPERAAATGGDQELLRRVLEAAVAWTSRTPFVEVLPWPGGAPFAAVVEPESGGPIAAPAEQWRHEIETAANDAGIARLAVSADSGTREASEGPLAAAIGELDRRGAWVATRSEVSIWTRQRAAVEASVRRAGPRRIVVEVTNFGRVAAARVVLRVFLNERALHAEAEATKLLQESAAVSLKPSREAVDLALPPLDPRASAAFSLDYEPAPSQDEAG